MMTTDSDDDRRRRLDWPRPVADELALLRDAWRRGSVARASVALLSEALRLVDELAH